jgi:hypothetical protein
LYQCRYIEGMPEIYQLQSPPPSQTQWPYATRNGGKKTEIQRHTSKGVGAVVSPWFRYNMAQPSRASIK